MLTCESGWGDCNTDAFDGCETDLSSNVGACGACGRDCRACGGTACNDGLCDGETLSSGPGEIALLAVDGASVVYADATGVAQVDKADAGVQRVYDVPRAPGLLVGDAIYFIYPNDGAMSASGIYRTYAGFVGPQVAAYARGEAVEAIAFDETGIYYAVEKERGVSAIVRCKNCSLPTELAPNENSLRQNAIALDATTVFFGAGDMIRRVEKVAEGLTTLAVGQSPRSLAVDDQWVYWINEAEPFPAPGEPPSGEIVRVKKSGGAPEVLLGGLEDPRFLVARGDQLYVTDRGREVGKGVLFRIEKDGSGRVDLAQDITSLGGLAVEESCAWFSAGPQVRRIAR